jgi:hypothetical protein
MTFIKRIQSCFSIDLRSMAIFRVAISICVITDLISRFSYINFFQTASGFLPDQTSLGVFAFLPHYWSDSFIFQVFLVVFALLFALMLLFGWYTRVATFVTWVLLVSLHSKLGISIDGADDFLRASMFWSIFLPLGAFWSIDSRSNNEARTNYFSLAGVGLILLFMFYYFSAGVSKINAAWLDGTALEVILRQEIWLRPAGEFLSQYPKLLKILTPTVIIFEILVPFVLLSPQRFFKIRIITICSFILFQLGLGLCIQLNMMPWIATAALLVFLPSGVWDNFLDKKSEIYVDNERFKSLIVIPFIIYVFGGFFIHKSGVTLPMYSKAYSLGLMSSWSFYNYPPEEDYDYKIIATLENGESVIILSSLNDKTDWKESAINSLWQNYRFKYYLEIYNYKKSRYANHFLNWIIDKWEDENPSIKVVSAQFYCSTKDILEEDGREKESVIAVLPYHSEQ